MRLFAEAGNERAGGLPDRSRGLWEAGSELAGGARLPSPLNGRAPAQPATTFKLYLFDFEPDTTTLAFEVPRRTAGRYEIELVVGCAVRQHPEGAGRLRRSAPPGACEGAAETVQPDDEITGLIGSLHPDVIALEDVLGGADPPVVGDGPDVVGLHAHPVQNGSRASIARMGGELAHGREHRR
jgi:hypothetical protein